MHAQVVDAVRHAQAAEEWVSAARLLADHGASLSLEGRSATLKALLAEFPAGTASTDPELALMLARAEVFEGSLVDAEMYIAMAERNASRASDERRSRVEVSLGLTRLMLDRQCSTDGRG
ncbi:MAG: hypothetical protein ACLP0J_01750 [Solirubrobacteraceae bacterium]|jgi:LuxR family maltose regulon positive regulatory protein